MTLAIIIGAVLILVGFWKPSLLENFFSTLDKKISRFAESRFAVIWIFLFALLTPIFLKFFLPLPEPKVHDEFAYLLQADTFAHGRLSNPPQPMWQFFETFHVLQQPTYAAKFPPGQAAFLTLGQLLFGKPIY